MQELFRHIKWRMYCHNFLFLIYWVQPGWGDEMLHNEYSKKPILKWGMGFFVFAPYGLCLTLRGMRDRGDKIFER